MINVLYDITLVYTIARQITQSTEEEVCDVGEGGWLQRENGGGRSTQSCQKRPKEEKACEQSVSDGWHLALGSI